MPAERFATSAIKNKLKREDVYRHQKKQRGQEKLKRRLALAEAERKDPEAKQVSFKHLTRHSSYTRPSSATNSPECPKDS